MIIVKILDFCDRKVVKIEKVDIYDELFIED